MPRPTAVSSPSTPTCARPCGTAWTGHGEEIDFGLSQCDVLKISDNEIEFMTGETDIDVGVGKLLQRHPIPLVLATMGPGGSKAFFRGQTVFAPPKLTEKTIETTGAGTPSAAAPCTLC